MDTGRFYVRSLQTGRLYCVEPLEGRRTDWGSIDPATGDLTHKKGWQKYKGAVKERDSVITPEGGFINITILPPGHSPMDYIEALELEI